MLDEETGSTAEGRSVAIAAVFLLVFVVVTSITPAEAANSGGGEATQLLIGMTRTAPLIVENLATILETPPGGTVSYDNELLAEECERRFLSKPIWGILESGTLAEILPENSGTDYEFLDRSSLLCLE